MGTDIHTFVEVRIDEQWHPRGRRCEIVNPNRNYVVFAHLAGVRNRGLGITPIDEPRGLPADAAHLAVDWFDPSNGFHSISWLNAAELIKHPWRGPTRDTTLTPVQIGAVIDPLVDLGLQEGIPPENIRIVFGFDS